MIRIMFHNLRHSVVRVFTKKNSGYITYFTLLESPPEEADDGRGNRQFHLLHPVWESPRRRRTTGAVTGSFTYFTLFGSPPGGGGRRAR